MRINRMDENVNKLIVQLNSCITNMKLYPPENPIVIMSLEGTKEVLDTFFQKEDSIHFAESESRLIVNGHVLNEFDQKKKHVKNMVLALIDNGIEYLEFTKGITQSEIQVFLSSIGQSSITQDEEKDVWALNATNEFPDIKLGSKNRMNIRRKIGPGKAGIDIPMKSQSSGKPLHDPKYDTILDTLKNLSKQIGGESVNGTPEALVLDEETFHKAVSSTTEKTDFVYEHIFEQLLITLEKKDKLKVIFKDDKNPDIDERELRLRNLSRFKTGFSNLVRGNKNILENEFILNLLPEFIFYLYINKLNKSADVIIRKLESWIESETKDKKDAIARLTLELSEELHAHKMYTEMHNLNPIFLTWISFNLETSPLYKRICIRLEIILRNLIHDKKYGQCTDIMQLFYNIVHHKIKIDHAGTVIAKKLIKTISGETDFDFLLREIGKKEDQTRNSFLLFMSLLGNLPMKKMLELLKASTSMTERFQIMRIIENVGGDGIDDILIQINRKEEYYYLRNLLILLSKSGNSRHLQYLTGLFKHDDFRVKREVLNCANIIGGNKRGDFFLSLLPSADETIKLRIISILAGLGYQDAVQPLIKLLTSSGYIMSKHKITLQEQICSALGKIGGDLALNTLLKVSNPSMIEKQKYTPRVRQAAKKASDYIIKNQEEALASAKTVKRDGMSFDDKIDQMVKDNNTDKAVNALFEMITKFAQEKKFATAEKLRNKLIEINELALTEIIKSGEIIEEEKSLGIGKDHLDLWPELYEGLTKEEANTLFYALEEKIFKTGDTLIERGKLNNNLFFIKKGNLEEIYKDGEEDTILKSLVQGDISGNETFFSISVCTTSVVAFTDTVVNILNRETLKKWKDAAPGLESKLSAYCRGFIKIKDLIRDKEINRRVHQRFDLKGISELRILKASGEPVTKAFRGRASDISVGGMSVFINHSNKDTARLLLGKNISIGLDVQGKDDKMISLTGLIIGVIYHLVTDYSLHIRFSQPLSEDHVNEIIAHNKTVD